MKLEIIYNHKSIDILGKLEFEPDPTLLLENFEVRLDGKPCPAGIRDIIIAGMSYQARITDLTFAEVVDNYLKNNGV